ncbi:MAG: acylneuraminate cytidylyltransferase family protein [Magnetococcales bacterium]|nr:acylneuraminate cytidylyltransferase family protein [Magnetococcales bacterium]
MLDNGSVLAVIPARGGSKGLPGKNILDLAGKPMIAWTIEAAQESNFVDRLILSSDDENIIEVAKEWNCEVPFIRPESLAGDTATSIDVAIHALDSLTQQYEYIVWLQPTAPLRLAEDIDHAIKICQTQNAPSCVSVVAAGKSPYWMYSLGKENAMQPIMPQDLSSCQRQELPKAYTLNGAVYVTKTQWLREHKKFMNGGSYAHIMPPERSIDIDSELDFKIAGMLLLERKLALLTSQDTGQINIPAPDPVTAFFHHFTPTQPFPLD